MINFKLRVMLMLRWLFSLIMMVVLMLKLLYGS